MAKAILYFTIALVFFGCQEFAIKEKLIDNYYLIATDAGDDCSLSYHEPTDGNNYGGVIEATVFAVGYNKSYLIAKQHPRTFPKLADKTITNYYILPLKKGMDWRIKNGLIGPLSIEQFNQTRKELKIPDSLSFSKVMEDLK